MLQKLYIKNFAIIKEIDISFSSGMTAITGETGAGKSILLGALQLLLGSRADIQVLLNKEEKCIIEAYFNIKNIDEVKGVLQENDIDFENELIVRREISNAGRSRAFINDTPCNLTLLSDLGGILVDLHRQFDTLELKDKNFKLYVIDTLAQNSATLIDYKNVFHKWAGLKRELLQLQNQKNELKKEYDYNSFLYNELIKLNFQPNEIENLEKDLNIMSHAESLKKALQEVQFVLQDADEPVLAQLKKATQTLNSFADKIDSLKSITERLSQLLIETKDIVTELDSIYNTVEYDEEKLNLMLEKYNESQKLLKKHNKQTTEELLLIQNELEEKLSLVDNFDEKINTLNLELNTIFNEVVEKAKLLSNKRNKSIKLLNEKVNALLPSVGMPSAQFKAQSKSTDYTENGIDSVEFLFDSNRTNNFQSISKIASGGELSRLMLCIKSLLANNTQLATLIFDEIDTGISGEVAKQVAKLLQQLSHNHQIICVTHLPQIASKSNSHLYIYKAANNDGQLNTNIKYLNREERINHIAEMLSGEKPTANAINIAKEMMQN